MARLGGDEFGLLLPETDKGAAVQIAKRICERFRGATISFHDRSINTSLSADVASLCPSDASFDALLHRADQKLYQSKQAGKDQTQT